MEKKSFQYQLKHVGMLGWGDGGVGGVDDGSTCISDSLWCSLYLLPVPSNAVGGEVFIALRVAVSACLQHVGRMFMSLGASRLLSCSDKRHTPLTLFTLQLNMNILNSTICSLGSMRVIVQPCSPSSTGLIFVTDCCRGLAKHDEGLAFLAEKMMNNCSEWAKLEATCMFYIPAKIHEVIVIYWAVQSAAFTIYKRTRAAWKLANIFAPSANGGISV